MASNDQGQGSGDCVDAYRAADKLFSLTDDQPMLLMGPPVASGTKTDTRTGAETETGAQTQTGIEIDAETETSAASGSGASVSLFRWTMMYLQVIETCIAIFKMMTRDHFVLDDDDMI